MATQGILSIGTYLALSYFEIENLRRCLGIQTHLSFKGRFLEFRRYHNFANLFSKLSEPLFSKK